jgi:tRNA threonylcarbamoyladenosine biosynthesis protein TsaB
VIGTTTDRVVDLLSFDPMLVLALDTTTRAGSCALVRDGVTVHELAGDPSSSHAEHLPGDLITLLESQHARLEAIDVFAVATGPGSFTGLRVGIATMQGLAFATGKPLVGVSALDALAQLAAADPRDTVATWIDAWRGEVYAALYGNGQEIEPPTVEHPADVLRRLDARLAEQASGGCVFIGDGAATFAGVIRTTLGRRARIADPVLPLLAGAIGRLAGDAAAAGTRPAPDAIRPLYVRRTAAELARDARAGR